MTVYRRRVFVVSASLMVLALAACDGDSPSAPSQPKPPATAASPQPQPEVRGVSGAVWLHGAGGAELFRAGSVFGWIDSGGRGATTGRIDISSNGRYVIPLSGDVTRVRVKGPSYQPCAVTVEPGIPTTTADVHIIQDPGLLGGHLPASLVTSGPLLSGMVYEETTSGRQPLANVWVTLDGLYGLGLMIADTITDADGRYAFCSVPFLKGLTVVAGLTGYQVFESTTDLTGLATFDFAMRRQ